MKKSTGVNFEEIARHFKENPPDFTPDEITRRATEVLMRCCGRPPSIDLDTGQPLRGERIDDAELRRRGYTTP